MKQLQNLPSLYKICITNASSGQNLWRSFAAQANVIRPPKGGDGKVKKNIGIIKILLFYLERTFST